ncbi:hypothetical protein L228DRAFT_237014 [Xylona heveae TC161]|uniref:Uncharacterized protein n=1 Tax=Xylona heveae (strain CBS 132557 / TC161) TaxID=1328760 RepID=A0A161TDT3_XYLHT|nr:hypothetical protein L228DRAFT_237014 [Xylona heveae TC161]KZF24047.1 hypothetical protein L228DRAFT_237014 [Xylona heveae TC161]
MTISLTRIGSEPLTQKPSTLQIPGPIRRQRSRTDPGPSLIGRRGGITKKPREPSQEDFEKDYSHECYRFDGDESIYRPHNGTFGILGDISAIKKDQLGKTLQVPLHYGFPGKQSGRAPRDGDLIWDYDLQEYVVIPGNAETDVNRGKADRLLHWENSAEGRSAKPRMFEREAVPSKGRNGHNSGLKLQSAPKQYVFFVNEHLYDLARPDPAIISAEQSSRGDFQRRNQGVPKQLEDSSFKSWEDDSSSAHSNNTYADPLIDPALKFQPPSEVDYLPTPPLTDTSSISTCHTSLASTPIAPPTPPPESDHPHARSYICGHSSEDSTTSLFFADRLPTPSLTSIPMNRFTIDQRPEADNNDTVSAEPLGETITLTLEEELDYQALFGEYESTSEEFLMQSPCGKRELGPLFPSEYDSLHQPFDPWSMLESV